MDEGTWMGREMTGHQLLREACPAEEEEAEGWEARPSRALTAAGQPPRRVGGRVYLIMRVQLFEGLLFDELFHCFHIQLFYPVVEVPQPQDHTVRTEHKVMA